MKWKDDRERALACRALLAAVGHSELWTATGPTARAGVIRTNLRANDAARRPPDLNGYGLSPAEVLFVRVAWDLWDGSGGATIAALIITLDDASRAVLGKLLTALAQGSHEQMASFIATAPPLGPRLVR